MVVTANNEYKEKTTRRQSNRRIKAGWRRSRALDFDKRKPSELNGYDVVEMIGASLLSAQFN